MKPGTPTKRAAKATAAFSESAYERILPDEGTDNDSQISEFAFAYSTLERASDSMRLEIELAALPKMSDGFGLCFELTLRIHRCTDDSTEELFESVIDQKHSSTICQSPHPVAIAMQIMSPVWQKRLKGRDMECYRFLLHELEHAHVDIEQQVIEGALAPETTKTPAPKRSI